jgi:hypothetical protein
MYIASNMPPHVFLYMNDCLVMNPSNLTLMAEACIIKAYLDERG